MQRREFVRTGLTMSAGLFLPRRGRIRGERRRRKEKKNDRNQRTRHGAFYHSP